MPSYPLILAHRGSCRAAPENTLAAFRQAIQEGADGVELDILLSADGVPVVAHGNNLERFTTSYKHIHSSTFIELSTLDIGRHFNPKFAGEKIPTLAQVLELFRPTTHLINIEIKSQPVWRNGIEKKVASLVWDFNLRERVIVSSFSPRILWRMKQAAPDIRRGFLLARHSFFFLTTTFFANVLEAEFIHPIFDEITPRLMRTARLHRWKVAAWTVNDRATIEKMIRLGVDILITDDVVATKKAVTDVLNG